LAGNFLKLSEDPGRDMAVLEVMRDSIEMSDWEAFIAAGRKLLASGRAHLVLDLRRLHRVLSLFIGEAVRLKGLADEAGKRFTVLAAGQVGDVFKTILGADILEMITDGRAPAEIGAPGESGRRRGDRWKL
jgi:hypothetical protein